MEAKTVLAIDPGSAKCGVALVRRDESGETQPIFRAISPVEQLAETIARAKEVASFSLVIVGSGTRSKSVVHRLREILPSVGILVVDESDTTLQARERYWEFHPRRGWRRLVPATLQTPPEPVDDFVALILAERVLSV
jgi:RNase H-fold protein (predicted Holliday junction resolvase)